MTGHTYIKRAAPTASALMTSERKALLARAEANQDLSPIERDILAGLRTRPLDMWCPGCDRIVRCLAGEKLQ